MAGFEDSLVEIATIVVARQVLQFGLDQVEWEDFPDIGEHDWERVMARAKDLAEAPERDEFDRAYALLKERAEHGGGEGEQR